MYLKEYGILKGAGKLNSPWSPKEINDKTGREVTKSMYMKELIKYIEDNNLEEAVATKVEETWLKAELSLCQNRKKKFES